MFVHHSRYAYRSYTALGEISLVHHTQQAGSFTHIVQSITSRLKVRIPQDACETSMLSLPELSSYLVALVKNIL